MFRAISLTIQLKLGRNVPAAVEPFNLPSGVDCLQSLEKLPSALSGKVIIDLRNIEMLRSDEIGALLELQKSGTKVVLLHAGSKVRKLWEFSKLTDRLPLAATCAEALSLLR